MNDQIKKYDVFISYRRKTAIDLARSLKKDLEKHDITCFYDLEDLESGFFPKRLEESIQNSTIFLFLHSENSLADCVNEKDFIRFEILKAFKNKDEKNMVILSKDTEALNKTKDNFPNLPQEILDFTSIQAVRWVDDYSEASLKKLIEIIRLDVDSRKKQAFENNETMDAIISKRDYLDSVIKYLEMLYKDSDIASDRKKFIPEINGIKYPILCYLSHTPEVGESYKCFEHRDLNKQDFSIIDRPVKLISNLNEEETREIPVWGKNLTLEDQRCEYFRNLYYSKRVKRWNMRGFSLKKLELNDDNEVISYEASLCTYGENILTSHVKDYILYLDFKKNGFIGNHALNDFDRPSLLLKQTTLSVGEETYPLIGVQALVVFHQNDDLKVINMKRSKENSAASELWQFPPSGGFEIYGTENDGVATDTKIHLKKQFDMRLALVREFLEEIFGDTELACVDPSNNKSHESSEGYNAVMDLIDAGHFKIHFLGVVTGLVSLRPEFSFLIYLDNVAYSTLRKLKYNVEVKTEQKEAKWLKGSSEGRRLESDSLCDRESLLAESKHWNPTSIGMLYLLAKHTKNENCVFRSEYGFPEINL